MRSACSGERMARSSPPASVCADRRRQARGRHEGAGRPGDDVDSPARGRSARPAGRGSPRPRARRWPACSPADIGTRGADGEDPRLGLPAEQRRAAGPAPWKCTWLKPPPPAAAAARRQVLMPEAGRCRTCGNRRAARGSGDQVGEAPQRAVGPHQDGPGIDRVQRERREALPREGRLPGRIEVERRGLRPEPVADGQPIRRGARHLRHPELAGAPARLSTTTETPSSRSNSGASARAPMSFPPPGG